MNSTCKPYRLINTQELNELQLAFEKKLQLWNEQYALSPLSCELTRNPTPPIQHTCLMFYGNAHPIALLHSNSPLPLVGEGLGVRVNVRAIIKHHLFGNTADCFNTISDTLFITLINQLFDTPTSQLQIEPNLDEWFYHGSPCLALTFNTITLYLHPQWVLNALPSHTKTQNIITNLTDALDPQPIQLQVELNPVSLRLNDVIRLQVGDVIKTDHPITTPLQLKQNQHLICTVEIGETHSYKSVQLTRPS